MSEGVDLYGLYNKVTDWSKVKKAGIEYAWIKLSDGNTIRDDYGYADAAKGVGILTGGYHYAQKGNPTGQANLLVDRCLHYGADELAPALDIEDPFVPGKEAADFSIAFLNQIIARGHTPCIYGNNSMLSGILPAVRKAVPTVKVWVARYGANPTVGYHTWQYTSTGRVNGISGDVDRNRGEIIRNTAYRPQMPIQPVSFDSEDDIMIVPATCPPLDKDHPTLTGDDYVSVPCNGKTLLFISTAFGRQVEVISAVGVKDNQPNGDPAYADVQEGLQWINPDEPGPIIIGAGCRVVQLRYRADHAFTAWCA